MTRVYLIRHGKPRSAWGDEGADPDPGLDDVGQTQAQAASDWLVALPAEHRPTHVLTSPLKRCRETALPFALALDVEPRVERLVAEIPTPSGLSEAERGPWLRTAFQQTWAEVPGDIDYADWRTRVARAVAGHGSAAIFTHFVAINAAVSAATGDERVLSFRPDHASITVFDSDGETLTLVEKGREAETGVL
jgi:broad specificity phosphatase PhoE